MKISFAVACAGLQLLLSGFSSAEPAEAERKSHTIPVGDAGVGLTVQLPPYLTMERPQGSYFYFGATPGGTGPEIWVYVFIEPTRAVGSTLDKAVSPIKRETIAMQPKPVEWLRWEIANGQQQHTFQCEAYLENLSDVLQDSFKAKRLKGLVVTISIGGLDRATVDTVQKCFIEAKLQESVLPPVGPPPQHAFVEAHYHLGPGNYFAGDSYEFRDGRFTCHYFSDVGTPEPEQGSYKVDSSRVTLFFDRPKPHPYVFFFRSIDNVHLILSSESLQTLESQGRLSAAYYISVPDVGREDREFWEKTRKHHPGFAKLLGEEPR